MINQNLHRQPVPLDRELHRGLKLALPVTDWSLAGGLSAVFVAAAEFADTCREFPVVFVRAGKEADGRDQIAPVAVLGLQQNENLFVQDGKWRALYMPAVLRIYPFCIGRMDADRFAVCVDMAWPGAQQTQGPALFEADGQPTALLNEMQQHMETMEGEIQRTRAVCARLLELDVLRDMRFDATLPDGRKHSIDGFLTVDENKMQNLPDDVVGDLHRNGLLGLIHLHWVSMGNMRKMVDWYAARSAGAPADAPAAVAANETASPQA
jgi:hypothetical protein